MNKKKVLYARPELGQEEFTRHLFSIYANDLGFEIINIQKKFPDCTAVDLRDGKNRIVNIELEYHAGNFISHGHLNQLEEGETCIVICWSGKGIQFIPSHIEVIFLSDKKYGFEIRDPYLDLKIEESGVTQEPLYRVISYVSQEAGGRSFEEFERVSMFRTNVKFSNNELPKGSVIVLREHNRLVGEFTVISYHWFERPPKTDYEKRLYELTTFPVTINDTYQDVHFENWTKGHIMYTDFKLYDPSVNFSILDRSKYERNFYIKFEELQKIRGLV
ncbi:hypothetical protein ACFQ4X_07035 [Fictibacillus halophilus]|uniref:hypothetical protein n=1 Tax=Fictibacillus halophilus TaxID=1610490 RepID=UPI00362C7793